MTKTSSPATHNSDPADKEDLESKEKMLTEKLLYIIMDMEEQASVCPQPQH